jgi:hypothetical protein
MGMGMGWMGGVGCVGRLGFGGFVRVALSCSVLHERESKGEEESKRRGFYLFFLLYYALRTLVGLGTGVQKFL